LIYQRIIISALLLLVSSALNAEERGALLLNLSQGQEYLRSTDSSQSLQEYEQIATHNRKFVLRNLASYSEKALEMMGISEEGIDLMGTALGIAFTNSKLHLNKSKSLVLQIKDATDSERTLQLGIELQW
jgi:hypothetical protein